MGKRGAVDKCHEFEQMLPHRVHCVTISCKHTAPHIPGLFLCLLCANQMKNDSGAFIDMSVKAKAANSKDKNASKGMPELAVEEKGVKTEDSSVIDMEALNGTSKGKESQKPLTKKVLPLFTSLFTHLL